MRPQTIQIFLPHGDPRGIRTAEITTRIPQVIEVPRPLLNDYVAMPESNQVALYFLFGQSEESSEPKVYIGQTGSLRKRLAKHNSDKDFWNRALVLISRTNSLTQTHALYLEWHCINEAKRAGRYLTENGNDGTRPHTPPPLEAECMEIFDTGRTLLATLGYPLFESVAYKADASTPAAELFYCKRAGTDAVGEYTAEGFVVLKGSKGRAQITRAFETHNFNKLRNELIAKGKIVVDAAHAVFTDDVLFTAPSGAAAIVCGAASNGWYDWRDENGVTLHDLKRQTPSGNADE